MEEVLNDVRVKNESICYNQLISDKRENTSSKHQPNNTPMTSNDEPFIKKEQQLIPIKELTRKYI